jgi:hypothetical protein
LHCGLLLIYLALHDEYLFVDIRYLSFLLFNHIVQKCSLCGSREAILVLVWVAIVAI